MNKQIEKLLETNDFVDYEMLHEPSPTVSYVRFLSKNSSKNGSKEKYIKLGFSCFALRKEKDEDNLLTFLKYFLGGKNGYLCIEKKDKKILFDIFGKDIFENEKEFLYKILSSLKDSKKIESYSDTNWGIQIIFEKKEDERLDMPEGLRYSLETITKDSEKFKKVGEDLKNNPTIKKFKGLSEKLSLDFSGLFKNISISRDNLSGSFSGIETLSSSINETLKTTFENYKPMFDSLEIVNKTLLETAKNATEKKEIENIGNQLSFIKGLFLEPEALFESILQNKEFSKSIKSIVKDNDIVEEEKESNNFTHSFEGYLQEGDFKTIRGFANIQDLANISKAIYFNDGGVQRKEDQERCRKIKSYIESGARRFFPEITIGLYLRDNGAIKIDKIFRGLPHKSIVHIVNSYKKVDINLNQLKDGEITRIDGNHRLFFADKIEQNFLVPFCFVIFDQKGEDKSIEEIHKNQEANIFYLLNGKNKPVSSEEALQVLLNMPDEEAESLYQNESTLGLTRLCKQKYDKFCCVGGSFKDNFGRSPFTKFEKLIVEIEKLNLENKEINSLLDLVFETIHPLGSVYNKIIKREDFLNLVLFPVLENKEKEALERNDLIKKFFDWILKEGLENISSSEKPILWELFQKQKSFKEILDIHSYQINENKRDGKGDEQIYKEFIGLVNESRKKIILTDIDEKRIGLEKIVDAYSKLLDILGNGGTDNAGRVDKIISRFFHSSNKMKMKIFLKDDLYDNLGKRIMNNDFAIRHHETDKEKLDDKELIEFLYSEYDNAIKFILDKASFLTK